MFIGHVITVQLKRTDDGINPLSVLLHRSHFPQTAVSRFLKEKRISGGMHCIREEPFSNQGPVAAVLLLHSQHIPRLACGVQLLCRKIAA